MKIIVSERQLKLLVDKSIKRDMSEVDNPADAQPTDGTSSSGDKQGYPEVGIWSTNIERGPANQIGVTKWSDIVGSLLTRGKANKLV